MSVLGVVFGFGLLVFVALVPFLVLLPLCRVAILQMMTCAHRTHGVRTRAKKILGILTTRRWRQHCQAWAPTARMPASILTWRMRGTARKALEGMIPAWFIGTLTACGMSRYGQPTPCVHHVSVQEKASYLTLMRFGVHRIHLESLLKDPGKCGLP